MFSQHNEDLSFIMFFSFGTSSACAARLPCFAKDKRGDMAQPVKGTSTIKYTMHYPAQVALPCIGVSERDSTLCANFESCEGKVINI